MENNKREITVVEVFKKLEEVQKELVETREQNKEVLAKLENMQESNALFHNNFATMFEVMAGLNEVKQSEEDVELLHSGSLSNILRVERMETAKADKSKAKKRK